MWKKNTKDLLMMFDINTMGKKAPDFIRAVMEVDSLGYGYDYISDRQLARSSVGGLENLSTASSAPIVTEARNKIQGNYRPAQTHRCCGTRC